jgi:hypothetical protein
MKTAKMNTVKVTEKLLSIESAVLKALIDKSGASYNPDRYGKHEYAIAQHDDCEIEVHVQEQTEDEPGETTGTTRIKGKRYKLDPKTCEQVIALVKENLENRDMPTANDFLKTKVEQVKGDMKEFTDGLEVLLTILSDERFEQVLDKLAPKLGTIVGKTIGGFVAASEKEFEGATKKN